MRVALIVRMDSGYLFFRNNITGKYELPSIECDNVADGKEQLRLALNNLGVGISIFDNRDIDLSDKGVLEVYEAKVHFYTTDNKNIWIRFEDGYHREFENWCLHICNFLSKKRKDELDIEHTIKSAIQKIVNELGVQIQFVEREKSVSVFLNSGECDYCPYVFIVKYQEENEEAVSVNVIWQISQMYAPGEKTDLYVLFADSMNILLKVLFNELAEVVYIGHVCAEDEIGGSVIILNNKLKSIYKKDLSHKLAETFRKFLIAMQMHYLLFGSYGLRPGELSCVEREWLTEKVKIDNTIVREDHLFYTNYEQGISMLELSKRQYKPEILIVGHEWEIVDGIDGKILVQYEKNGKSYNLVPEQRWECVQRILKDNKCEKYTIVCQENKLYLLEENRIWILEGGFYHYWVEEEREKLLERQKKENEILFFDKNFKWKYPIAASRFEELIADLIELEPRISRVRLMGKSNNSDGGRDILIYKMRLDNGVQSNKEYLVIGQCKAYKHSVNKSQVTDIRDMLENYNAKGFILVVASELTVPLIDNLNKLAEKYEVEWWTGREIFSKLRRNYYLLERYKDIVEVVKN